MLKHLKSAECAEITRCKFIHAFITFSAALLYNTLLRLLLWNSCTFFSVVAAFVCSLSLEISVCVLFFRRENVFTIPNNIWYVIGVFVKYSVNILYCVCFNLSQLYAWIQTGIVQECRNLRLQFTSVVIWLRNCS